MSRLGPISARTNDRRARNCHFPLRCRPRPPLASAPLVAAERLADPPFGDEACRSFVLLAAHPICRTRPAHGRLVVAEEHLLFVYSSLRIGSHTPTSTWLVSFSDNSTVRLAQESFSRSTHLSLPHPNTYHGFHHVLRRKTHLRPGLFQACVSGYKQSTSQYAIPFPRTVELV